MITPTHVVCGFVATTGYRVTKKQAACFMFCDLEHYVEWKAVFRGSWMVRLAQTDFFNKSPVGSLLGRANGPRHCSTETIFMQSKGIAV